MSNNQNKQPKEINLETSPLEDLVQFLMGLYDQMNGLHNSLAETQNRIVLVRQRINEIISEKDKK